MCNVFYALLFSFVRGMVWALISQCKIDEADCTGRITFLSSNLMEKISPNPESLIANTQNLSSAWNGCKDKNDLSTISLIEVMKILITSF